MSTTSPATRLVTAAARSVLRPIGLRQRGRSRIWLDDRGWWLGVVEFQPSSWSQGSHLNVGVMWLWHDIDHFAFHLGHREGGHEPFRNEAQFAKAAEDLAQLASTRIAGYRGQFPDVTSAARHLAAQPLRRGYPWDGFDAGIAAALSGDATGARRLLEHFLSQETGTPASPGLRSAQEVYDLADDTPGVHAWALAKVSSCRTKLRLDPYVDSEVFGRAGGDASIG